MESGKQFKKSAKECAQYIVDSDCEHDSYCDWVDCGEDPREHILYHAGVVLDCEYEFKGDVLKYRKAAQRKGQKLK
jgi:hypothetical protein